MASISDKAYLVNAFDIRRNNYIGSLHRGDDCETIEQYVLHSLLDAVEKVHIILRFQCLKK